jgi:hypothetical protein
MGDDVPAACCGSGICCDKVKQKIALTKLFEHAAKGISTTEAEQCAQAIMDTFDMVPKGLLSPLIKFVQEHPYE